MEKDCNTCKFELYKAEEIPCRDCGMDDREYWQAKPQTNADRIRAMSDEELAEFIRDVSYECQDAYCGNHCPMCAYPWCSSERTMEWLKQPAEGD